MRLGLIDPLHLLRAEIVRLISHRTPYYLTFGQNMVTHEGSSSLLQWSCSFSCDLWRCGKQKRQGRVFRRTFVQSDFNKCNNAMLDLRLLPTVMKERLGAYLYRYWGIPWKGHKAGFPSSQATPRQPTPQRVPRLPQSKKFRLMYRSLSTDWSNSRAIPEPVGSISIWTKCFFRIFTSCTRQTRVAKITSRVFERRSSVAPTNAFRCWRPNANQTPPTIPINTFRFFSLPWGRRSICCLLHRWIFLARIWSLKIKIWVFEVWLRKRNFYRRKRLDFILQGGKRGG